MQSSAFADAQSYVRLLKATAIILPILALLCLVGSVWLARDRAARDPARGHRRWRSRCCC